MFGRKKKEMNYTLTAASLAIGTAIGLAYALFSTKQTGEEFKKDIRKKADKAIKSSKKKLSKEFNRAKKELSDEFETQITKSVANIKDKSKDLFTRVKTMVN